MAQTQTAKLLEMVDAPPSPGEIDMITEVTRILEAEGFSPESLQVFQSDPNIQFAVGKNANVQRYKLNLFLNAQYLQISSATQMERGMLLDAGTVDNWMSIFRTVHVPALRAFGLPRPYLVG